MTLLKDSTKTMPLLYGTKYICHICLPCVTFGAVFPKLSPKPPSQCIARIFSSRMSPIYTYSSFARRLYHSKPSATDLRTGPLYPAVDAEHRVQVLNLKWDVPLAQSQQGVWVTINLALSQATLFVFDDAPDVTSRKILAQHPFQSRKRCNHWNKLSSGKCLNKRFTMS